MYQAETTSVVPEKGWLNTVRPVTSTATCIIIKKPAVSPIQSRRLMGTSIHFSSFSRNLMLVPLQTRSTATDALGRPSTDRLLRSPVIFAGPAGAHTPPDGP